jgi:hypothetical protein
MDRCRVRVCVCGGGVGVGVGGFNGGRVQSMLQCGMSGWPARQPARQGANCLERLPFRGGREEEEARGRAAGAGRRPRGLVSCS